MRDWDGGCTCKKTNDWCFGCGHDRRHCFESCQRGLHGFCTPEKNRFVEMEPFLIEGVESDSER